MTTVNRAGRRRALPTKTYKKLSKSKDAIKPDISEESPLDAQDLNSMMGRVQQHVDMFQYEEARDVCSRAVLLAPDNADIRFQLGSICLELGDFQGGFENIRYSLNVEPETTPDRFFAFAQLIPGREAVQVYEHGLKVYSEKYSEGPEFKRKVSTACCAAAEIFMTDLCDEEDAEQQCSDWLNRALQTDPINPEVFRVMADLKICQQLPSEAREMAIKACDIWSQELETLMNPTDDQVDQLMAEFPSYESRISCAKILIELNEADLLERAVLLLEQLLKEDDSVLMTWYLLCLTLKTKNENDNLSALEDAIEGALRVSRRDGHLKYPEMITEDELVLEILNWYRELGMDCDLDAIEEEDDDDILDLEKTLKEAESFDTNEFNTNNN